MYKKLLKLHGSDKKISLVFLAMFWNDYSDSSHLVVKVGLKKDP